MSRGSNILRLAGAAAAAGVLTAAIALPAIGGAGAMFITASDDLNLKPEDLKEPPLAEKTEILDAKGNQIAQFYEEYREVIPLADVAEVMKTAIISIEDFRFYEHGADRHRGHDPRPGQELHGGRRRPGRLQHHPAVRQAGAVNSADTEEEKAKALETSYARKLNELRYAMAVEKKYTKDEILEKYLNIAYFGAGANGVEAAAKRFFGVPAADLSLAQAATLAGAVQDPNRTDPNLGKDHRKRLLERRNVVLNRMARTQEDHAAGGRRGQEAEAGLQGHRAARRLRGQPYPYFCMYVRTEMLGNPVFGKTKKQRAQLLNRGGLTIKTTLDPKMQSGRREGDQEARLRLRQPGRLRGPGGARHRADQGDGRQPQVRHSKRKNEMSYNVVADAAHGGGIGFQPGSTFKTFTLLTALKKGMKINDGFSVGAGYRAPFYSTFKNCKGENIGDPSHTVTNDEGSGGFKTLQTGTWGSVNTFFMKLEERVGLCDTIKTAKSLGIKRADGLRRCRSSPRSRSASTRWTR